MGAPLRSLRIGALLALIFVCPVSYLYERAVLLIAAGVGTPPPPDVSQAEEGAPGNAVIAPGLLQRPKRWNSGWPIHPEP